MRLPWARYALAGAGVAVVVALTMAAIHAHGSGADAHTSERNEGNGPLVSRGKPVFCSPSAFNAGGPNALTSGKYGAYSYWRTDIRTFPSWCAIHVGAGPKRLLVVWMSDYISNYLATNGMTPRDYTLSVSSDSADGDSGHWRTVVTVTGNETRVREAAIPFTGMSWVKMTLTAGQAAPTQPYVTIDQIDCYDVSESLNDTAVFAGDSITIMGYNRFDGSTPAFDELVHHADPTLFPAMLDEGFGGAGSSAAVQAMPAWLSLNPDIHYWFLGIGSNDALTAVTPTAFRANIQRLVDLVRQAGRVPVLARIPAMRLPGERNALVNSAVQRLNEQIDAVTRANRLIPGPDLYTLFTERASAYLLPDGIHPTPAGAVAMNAAWYQAMRATFLKIAP